MAGWRRQRATRPWLNHLVRAASHYGSRQADLYAAGITYFGFLALFPLLLLAVSVAGFVLAGRPDLLQDLIGEIRTAVPGDLGQQLVDGLDTVTEQRGTVGIIGLVGLLYAGLGWMGKLRVAIQTIWSGAPAQPNIVKAYLLDLVALIGLGGALLASVAVTAVANGLTGTVLELVGLDGVTGVGLLTRVLGIVVSIAGTTLIFLWLFLRLPQVEVSAGAVLPGAVFGAVGFEIIKLVGTLYLGSVSSSPAFIAVGGVVGLLIWIYIVCRFLLFSAAWTSTLPAVIEQRRQEVSADGPADPVVAGPPVPALQVSSGVPSAGVVAAGLVGVGAAVGTGATVLVRRWWRVGRRGRHS